MPGMAGCPAWDLGDVHLWENPVEEEGPQGAHPAGLPGQNHPWDLATQLAAHWTQGGYVEHRNPEQRSGNCEFPLLSHYLSSSKAVGQGREETHPHCWGTLPSQAPRLDTSNVLATVPLPMGKQLPGMTCALDPWEGAGPHGGVTGVGRTGWQLLVGAAAVPCLLARAPHRRWVR